ncbi:MAG: P63C domain-containing protein [Dehalococcoidia bacterium]
MTVGNVANTKSSNKISDTVKPLRATHGSPNKPLKIGNAEIPAYVLSNGTRILSGRGLQQAFAPGQKSGGILKSVLTNLLSIPRAKELARSDLLEALASPIRFIRQGRGGRLATGYQATILADICDFLLEARSKGLLKVKRAILIAEEAEILQRGFAKVGIIALVDEVTGYQEYLNRAALQKILDAYLLPYAAAWAKRFPDSFYKSMFKLKGWAYDPGTVKRPSIIGTMINDIVYSRLAQGILEELRTRTPKDATGRCKRRYRQSLTWDIGHPKLQEHLLKAQVLMDASPNYRAFYRMLQRALPKLNETFVNLIPSISDNYYKLLLPCMFVINSNLSM